MAFYRTPGVYIKEKSAFGISGVPMPTAVPAFIGYTERATRGNTSLVNVPTKVYSLQEYEKFFGGAPKTTFKISANKDTGFSLVVDDGQYYLYNCMRLFFDNGGGSCYIVSVGDYFSDIKVDALSGEKTGGGLQKLLLEQEPTMIVVPDANLLEEQLAYKLYGMILKHCGFDTKSRFAIFDVFDGHKERTFDANDPVNKFREYIGDSFLNFGAAYYPWLNTSIVGQGEVDYRSISNVDGLVRLLNKEAEIRIAGQPLGPPPKPTKPAAVKKGDAPKAEEPAAAAAAVKLDPEDQKQLDLVKNEIARLKDENANFTIAHQNVLALSPLYKSILGKIQEMTNLLPPSAAMAGIYSVVDNVVGVHKAPANTAVKSVISPAVPINSDAQEDLNMPISGKAINAIRTFLGKGILVWGARTLDGNSQDWRYINVRRSMIFIQQTVKSLMESFVFDPNTPSTWVKVRVSISNFLTTAWQQNILVGPSPAQAFEVSIGLGSTMTPLDILDGMMKISIKVALSRPAEFIEITFQQKMQEGGEGATEAV